MSRMKEDKIINVSSPKTPGGISKSLLTPCRRLGLSRKWRNSGPSPFISPLAADNSVKKEPTILPKRKGEPSKRRKDSPKKKIPDENCEEILDNPEASGNDDSDGSQNAKLSQEIGTTPLRNIELPSKSISKTLLSKLDSTSNQDLKGTDEATTLAEVNIEELENSAVNKDLVSKPKREKSVRKSKSKAKQDKVCIEINSSPSLADGTDDELNKKDNIITEEKTIEVNTKPSMTKTESETDKPTPESPNNLTKKCIVVIQRKINKGSVSTKQKQVENKQKERIKSQALFDSDSDDIPLSTINKKQSVTKIEEPKKRNISTLDEDDDFHEKPSSKIKKLEDKSTSITDIKMTNTKDKLKKNRHELKSKVVSGTKTQAITPSFGSVDEDEDFEFDKRTILIKKTYHKVIQPLKAKPTGSITQKDIDDLKQRIELKKNILLAKTTMTTETGELMNLVKKWKKGCQDALTDLLELMRTKYPDRYNMDYSEILDMLKIPSGLVGYDSENDCFITPDDKDIILSKFNV